LLLTDPIDILVTWLRLGFDEPLVLCIRQRVY